MSYIDLVDDTICALITTPGLSGISVVRVSGKNALSISRKICPFLKSDVESHRVYLGRFKTAQGEIIDEGLVTYFAEGQSFTADETLEFSLHGGKACAEKLLQELLSLGCRAAERGEFSFRAFYNGKIDLVQAEAIHSLIKSRNDMARSQAVGQLTGVLSQQMDKIEQGLIHVLAQLEASIDFSTEDIEPYSLDKMKQSISEIHLQVEQMSSGFKKGRILTEGLKVVIAGAPNAGKSSLYNALLGQEKAIVSAVPGTTRDTLESTYSETGMPLSLIDTAGLRDSDEEVEKIGIERALQRLEEADFILFVLDAANEDSWDFQPVLHKLEKTVFILSKLDQNPGTEEIYTRKIAKVLNSQPLHRIFLTSSKTLVGIQGVKGFIDTKSLVDIHHDEALITQHRQHSHLQKCSNFLQRSLDLFDKQASYDLLAIEIQSALAEIFAMLGKEFDEQVMDHVFKQFCIGK